jgi:hypothetical protein
MVLGALNEWNKLIWGVPPLLVEKTLADRQLVNTPLNGRVIGVSTYIDTRQNVS